MTEFGAPAVVVLKFLYKFARCRIAPTQSGKQVIVLFWVVEPIQEGFDLTYYCPEQHRIGFARLIFDVSQELSERYQCRTQITMFTLNDG